jgi:hypothetical protein
MIESEAAGVRFFVSGFGGGLALTKLVPGYLVLKHGEETLRK